MPSRNDPRKKLSPQKRRELDVKISFMEGLVRRDPRYVEALQLLGDHYTQRGRFQEGLRIDRRLSRLDPGNPLAFYNLACSYSLTGQFEAAVKALQKAIQLGYRDFRWLARDPDLQRLRKQSCYAKVRMAIREVKAELR